MYLCFSCAALHLRQSPTIMFTAVETMALSTKVSVENSEANAASLTSAPQIAVKVLPS